MCLPSPWPSRLVPRLCSLAGPRWWAPWARQRIKHRHQCGARPAVLYGCGRRDGEPGAAKAIRRRGCQCRRGRRRHHGADRADSCGMCPSTGTTISLPGWHAFPGLTARLSSFSIHPLRCSCMQDAGAFDEDFDTVKASHSPHAASLSRFVPRPSVFGLSSNMYIAAEPNATRSSQVPDAPTTPALSTAKSTSPPPAPASPSPVEDTPRRSQRKKARH